MKNHTLFQPKTLTTDPHSYYDGSVSFSSICATHIPLSLKTKKTVFGRSNSEATKPKN